MISTPSIGRTSSVPTSTLECGDGFECSYRVSWFRVVHGGAPCTLVLVYISIRLSEFRLIERFSRAVTAEQVLSPGTSLIS